MTDTQAVRDRVAFLRSLRSVRHFRSDPVPQVAIDDILDVARWSGSANNVQPWEFIVVQDRTALGTLAALDGYVKHLAGAPLAIVIVLSGSDRYEQETFDDGKVSERMMLAGHAHGLGSCIGWFAGARRDEAKRILGVPANHVVRTAISFGYPDDAGHGARQLPTEARKPLAAIVHAEQYRAQ